MPDCFVPILSSETDQTERKVDSREAHKVIHDREAARQLVEHMHAN